jgi:hypothetical protein
VTDLLALAYDYDEVLQDLPGAGGKRRAWRERAQALGISL